MTKVRQIRTVLLVLAFFCGACGAAVEQVHETDIAADVGPPSGSSGEAGDRAQDAPRVAITTVTRAELIEIVERGPGALLAMVQVDSVVENGVFGGFRIVSFRTDAQEVLGLTEGDVLVKVNGISVERPEYLAKIMDGLSTAQEISFEITRAGKAQTVKTPVLP